MDVFEAIKNRRSVRKYKPELVPKDLVQKILEAAVRAPSASNIQPWNFIVIKDRKVLDMVRKISPGYFGDAPLAILVCSDKERAYKLGGELGRDYLTVADCALAVQNMLLAAYASGLGTCIVKSFSSTAIKHILEIPDGIEPELLVIVGYPDQSPKPPLRRPLQEIAYLNRYGEKYFEK
ncbi:MAG: nitroreductase family protein [Candidatus Bathyarchaeota archaeon]|nr:nitroreductase family protein [Candidatus Bathyarchaeota archaeon]MDH5746644.1 nitroreductase family protein [Candidatus Bathyarchaeota archaeon]